MLEVAENSMEFATAGFGIGKPFVPVTVANVATSFEVDNRASVPVAWGMVNPLLVPSLALAEFEQSHF